MNDEVTQALKSLLALVKFEFKGRAVPEPWASAIARAEAALSQT
ncbi:hypothetical protein [Mesorhizobium sp.]|nr:hypothetical protein [Mesorhizobium sp.]